MNHAIKMTALAVFAASFAAPVLADTATTKGGFQIKSEDGNFSAKLGGRIHLDANVYTDDDDIKPSGENQFFFRRARLTIEGKAYDFTYKFENDFAGQDDEKGSGFREMWIGKKVLGGHNLRLGQAKPYRGMEELTSSNEVTFMERPLATATGIYKQFTTGVFLDGSGKGYGYGVSAYSPTSAEDEEKGGFGFNARGFVVPVSSDSTVVHLGLSASADDYDLGSTKVEPRIVGREKGLKSTILPDTGFNEQTTVGLEAAAMFGPLLVQAEYARASFENSNTSVENDVNTGYVQAAYMLTSHQRRYDAKKGVFKSPKVDGKTGALELKARYDMIENKDINGAEADYFAVGLNYYATPNTRFMVEYVDGTDENGAGKDAAVITARAQFNF